MKLEEATCPSTTAFIANTAISSYITQKLSHCYRIRSFYYELNGEFMLYRIYFGVFLYLSVQHQLEMGKYFMDSAV